jgi:hypothetical protein
MHCEAFEMVQKRAVEVVDASGPIGAGACGARNRIAMPTAAEMSTDNVVVVDEKVHTEWLSEDLGCRNQPMCLRQKTVWGSFSSFLSRRPARLHPTWEGGPQPLPSET